MKKGNGDLKVQISSDEEGNSNHGLYYGLQALKDIDKDDKENRESIMQLMEDVDDRKMKEYCITYIDKDLKVGFTTVKANIKEKAKRRFDLSYIEVSRTNVEEIT